MWGSARRTPHPTRLSRFSRWAAPGFGIPRDRHRCDCCQIDTGKPQPLDRDEPRRVAESVQKLESGGRSSSRARWTSTAPTAAFSRRDTLLPGYADAVRAAQRAGFEAVIRPVGGHLAAYDAGALVLHLWGAHSEPRRDLRQRFAIVADVMAESLRDLGVPDVRVGPVPGEYCDGEWSVNVRGRSKLVGTGQRLFRDGFLFCAVVMVRPCEGVRHLLIDAYGRLGLPLDPATVAGADTWVPGIDPRDVGDVVGARLVEAVGASAVSGSIPVVVS